MTAMRIKTRTDLIPEETKKLKRDVDNEEQNDFGEYLQCDISSILQKLLQ